MQRDLNAILGHIAQLNELDTAGVPAMAQVGAMLDAAVEGTGRRVCVGMECGLRWTGGR